MKQRTLLSSLVALSCAILLISGLKLGIGPFLAIYLKSTLKWDPNQIGIALGVMNFAAMLNFIPSGLLIDAYKIKRHLLIVSCVIIAISSTLIAFFPEFPVIIILQFFIGLAAAVIPQGIVALTLGLVGTKQFPVRQSTNESLSHAGNILIALTAGFCAYFFGNIWILYIYACFAISGILPITLIKGKDINHAVARELAQFTNGLKEPEITPIRRILSLPSNILFFISVFLFHFSSSSQLPLVGQLFVQIEPKRNALFMANSIVVSHLIMMLVAIVLRFKIQNSKRKPIFLLAFIVIFIRSILFTVSHSPYFFIAVQILDGISGGIFGVLSVVIIAELAANTGRFNFMHAVMVLCQGLGYAASNIMSGYIAKLYGFNTSFYILSLFAVLGFFVFLLTPETLKKNNSSN